MKYPRHPFSIFLCCYAVLAALLLLVSSCTDEAGEGIQTDNGDTPVTLAVHSTINDFTGSPSTRTPIEGDTSTKFSKGDAIGLFAVKGIGTTGATFADDINNIKLTYTPSTDATDATWTPADAGTTLYYYPDVTYIAYYPYKEGVTITPTKSTNDIISALAARAEFQPAADQSTPELYTACDLMTASGTAVDSSDPTKKTLSLTFSHQYALLILKTNTQQPLYRAPGESFYYHPLCVTNPEVDTQTTDVFLNGVKAYKIASGVFRAIVKPGAGTSNTLSGTYLSDGKTIEYSGMAGTAASILNAGKYYELAVNLITGAPLAIRDLQIGDFYYADGTVWPGGLEMMNTDPAPVEKDCIGIVFWIGNPCEGDGPDTADYFLPKDHSKCNNGLVIAIDAGPTTTTWSTGDNDLKKWADELFASTSIIDMRSKTVYQGYGNTKMMGIFNKMTGQATKLPIMDALDQYILDHPAPAKSSGWYIPSYQDITALYSNNGSVIVTTQLAKLPSAIQPRFTYYYISTEYTDKHTFAFNLQDNRGFVDKSSKQSIRPILAF